MSKSQEIISFFKADPSNIKVPVAEVAKKFGVKVPTVYALRARLQGKPVKRRKPSKGQRILRTHIAQEAIKVDHQNKQYTALMVRTNFLEEENRNLRTVVAYLEKKVFNGAAI